MHFALCQMIETYGQGGRCRGFGEWDAGSSPSYDELIGYQDKHYPVISELVRVSGSKPRDIEVEPSSIVIISAGYADEGLISEILATSLRMGALVFLVGFRSAAAVGADYPRIAAATQGIGLIEIALGPGILLLRPPTSGSPRIEALFSSLADEGVSNGVERAFRRAGEGLSAIAAAASAKAISRKAHEKADAAISAQRATEAELHRLQNLYEHRGSRLASYESRVFDLEREAESARAEMDALTRRAEQSSTDLISERHLVASLNAQLVECAKDKGLLEAARHAHYRETAYLTKELEKNRRDRQDLIQSLQRKNEEASHLEMRAAVERRLRFKEAAALTALAESSRVEATSLGQEVSVLERSLRESEARRLVDVERLHKIVDRESVRRAALDVTLEEQRKLEASRIASSTAREAELIKRARVADRRSREATNAANALREWKETLTGSLWWRLAAPLRTFGQWRR